MMRQVTVGLQQRGLQQRNCLLRMAQFYLQQSGHGGVPASICGLTGSNGLEARGGCVGEDERGRVAAAGEGGEALRCGSGAAAVGFDVGEGGLIRSLVEERVEAVASEGA